jgi:hypothetical protein
MQSSEACSKEASIISIGSKIEKGRELIEQSVV